MTTHRILVGFSVLLIAVMSMTAEGQTKARSALAQYQNSPTILFVNNPDAFRIAKRLGFKVQMVKLSRHELEKLPKLPATGCSCAPSDEDRAGCFKSCLRDYGISDILISDCGTACALGPVACGLCLGISIWNVLECAVSCSPPWITSNRPVPSRLNLRHVAVREQQANLLHRPMRVALR